MKMLVIDGNSIINRAFYGIRLLSNKKGVFTNAVTGFMNIYLKELDIVKPDCVAAAFDMRTKTFRHKAVSTYKANRKGMPDELAMQLPFVKELLAGLGVSVIECEGYEADDILGTLSEMCRKNGDNCVVLTGDRDSLQLINDNVTVRLVTNKETINYDEKLFIENYGFEPIHLIDLKALMGDSSDNISGVPGIGEKTATSLIQKYKTIEKLYSSIEEAGLSKGVQNKLVSGEEAAKESKWLATICREAPVSVEPSDYLDKPEDRTAVGKLLTELEMFKMLDRLGISPAAAENPEEDEYFQPGLPVRPAEKELTDQDILKFEDSYYVFDTDNGSVKILSGESIYKTASEELILKYFETAGKKFTFDAKKTYRYLFERGRKVKETIFDVQIAAYLLDPLLSEYDIDKLCALYRVQYDPEDQDSDILCLDNLCRKLSAELKSKNMDSLFYDTELPLTEVLASMETEGICVDVQGVKEFGEMLSERIEKSQKEIFDAVGEEFNISSPKQLGHILFEVMGLPAKKKTKSGYSTNADVLEELRPMSPVIDMILEFRQLSKLRSTYVDGLLKTVSSDGKIHTVFKQTETRTGRISSTEPNMQNIPVRTTLGKEMRKFFRASEGKILLDADYSQIELRIMAHMCDDKNMQKAFTDGTDIHTSTASQVFGMPEEMVTSQMRSAAKAVNFGIIYGIGAFSLSKDINVSVPQAKKYIENYLGKYPNVKKFMDETVDSAEETGYVKTMFGRQRPVPELRASNKMVQAAGRRIAINTPVQGTAADIIKIAMVRVFRRLEKENLNAKLILQVHDELIVETDLASAERAAACLEEEMENAVKLSIPLTADVQRGETWYEAKG